mgnify:CR=1 FL=1
MRMTTRYRELIKRPQIAVMVGAYDALSAKLVERAGFDLTFVHDYGVSASLLGMPDMGLVTLTEMTDILEKVVKAVNIPVIGDGGCGFGNPLNTWRTVREYESIGVAGVNLEDQVYPKRCGHLAGKQVVEPAEMVEKIRAAVDARKDPDFVITARVDSIAIHGLDDAIKRANIYVEAGADMIFPEFPNSDLTMPKRFAEEVHKEFPGLPLYFNYSSNLKWFESGATFDDVAAIGFNMMHVSLAGLRTSMQAMFDYAADLKKRGAVAEIEYEKKLLNHPMGSCNEFAGFPKIKALEEKYLSPDELKKKYQ